MCPGARVERSAWVTQEITRRGKPKLAFRARRPSSLLKQAVCVTSNKPQLEDITACGLIVRKGHVFADCGPLRESVPLAVPASPEFGCLSRRVPEVNISPFYPMPLRLAGRRAAAWPVPIPRTLPTSIRDSCVACENAMQCLQRDSERPSLSEVCL